MKKSRIIPFFLLLISILVLGTVSAEENAILLYVNGEPVTKTEATEEYATLATYYQAFYDIDLEDPEIQEDIEYLAIVSLVQKKVALQKAHELGFDSFTEEEETAFVQEAERLRKEQIDALIPYYGDTDEKAALANANAFADSLGYDTESLIEQQKMTVIMNRIYEITDKDSEALGNWMKAAELLYVDPDLAALEGEEVFSGTIENK